MTNKNYHSGKGYESRFVKERLREGALISKRFYASRGITDVYWVSQDTTYNEAQLKFSRKTPRISKTEMGRLDAYARLNPFPVYLVKKSSRKKEEWRKMN